MIEDEIPFRILLLFIDGLGIGDENPSTNPCMDTELQHLSVFMCGGKIECRDESAIPVPTDAQLGIDGLPQSATGQTTLLSGKNAASAVGRHLPGFPNQVCRDILKQSSLLKQVKQAGQRAVFINAFRPIFFKLPAKQQWRLSATTVANLAAGLPFKRLEDIGAHKALYHDFTNTFLNKKGFPIPQFSAEQAGQIAAQLSAQNNLSLFEYFKTDRAGHRQNLLNARSELRRLDRFLGTILKQIDLTKTLVVLTSDHGNIEDLSVKTHTQNPAMTLAWGKHKLDFSRYVKSLIDITPALMKVLKDHDLETSSANQEKD